VIAAETSPSTGRRYGIAQVCRIWEVPRSSFYADRRRADTTTMPLPPQRRGPKPVVSDDALLAAIRADLARSPWHGEGHRKVWARLRVMDGIRVARKRVLRLMRENALLSPHRARTRDDTPHDRHIITDAPNLMWAELAKVPPAKPVESQRRARTRPRSPPSRTGRSGCSA
jgi:putative transposase